jgi:hypothetical protein
LDSPYGSSRYCRWAVGDLSIKKEKSEFITNKQKYDGLLKRIEWFK